MSNWSRLLNWKGPGTYPSPPNRSKISEKYCPCLYLSTDQVWWVNELWLKRYIQKWTVLCTNTYHDVTYLVNHRMVKNKKTWIPRERYINFLWDKKIVNLCFKYHILSSFCFVAEVIFKGLHKTFCGTTEKSENKHLT